VERTPAIGRVLEERLVMGPVTPREQDYFACSVDFRRLGRQRESSGYSSHDVATQSVWWDTSNVEVPEIEYTRSGDVAIAYQRSGTGRAISSSYRCSAISSSRGPTRTGAECTTVSPLSRA
jgi:hypothetical protein